MMDRYGVTLPVYGTVYVEVEMPADPVADSEGWGPSTTTPDGRKFHTRQDAIHVLAMEAAADLLRSAPRGPADKVHKELKTSIWPPYPDGATVTRLNKTEG
jgi:hypothetical protein